jgi:hypothetical protein
LRSSLTDDLLPVVIDFTAGAGGQLHQVARANAAHIPASDLTTGGADSITVVAAGPGSGASDARTFTVNNPAPILMSISPTSIAVGSPDTTITLNGNSFVNGSTADFNGTPITTTFVSATQLTAVIPAPGLTTVGASSTP